MHCNNLLSTLIKIVMEDAIKLHVFDLLQYIFIYLHKDVLYTKMPRRMFIICYQTNVCIKSYPCN